VSNVPWRLTHSLAVLGEGSRGEVTGHSYIRGSPHFFLNRGPAWSKSSPAVSVELRLVVSGVLATCFKGVIDFLRFVRR